MNHLNHFQAQILLDQQGEYVSTNNICFYPSIEALVKAILAVESWPKHETFVFEQNNKNYLILCHTADIDTPWKTMVIGPNGLYDLLDRAYFEDPLMLPILKDIAHGMTPDVKFQHQKQRADAAFAEYDFRTDDQDTQTEVVDSDGWDSNDSQDWIKIVYLRYPEDTPETPSHKISFHVNFGFGSDKVLREVYALEVESGNYIGQSHYSEQDLMGKPKQIKNQSLGL